jgi:uncharacterized lipoprotein
LEPGKVLGVVVMMVMPVVVLAGCKRRAGTNQQQKGGEDQLLHALKISTILACQYGLKWV